MTVTCSQPIKRGYVPQERKERQLDGNAVPRFHSPALPHCKPLCRLEHAVLSICLAWRINGLFQVPQFLLPNDRLEMLIPVQTAMT